MTTRPMKAAMFAVVLALAAVAHGDDAVRKGASDKFAKAAGEAFKQAVAADKSGDLHAALGLYQKAFEISPHPSTIYNIADVQRRLQMLPEALKSYEIYLAIAPPDAADRKEVEAAIDKLHKTPGMLWVSTTTAADPRAIDLTNAYILVDGEVKKQPGVEIHTGPNNYKDGFGMDIRGGNHVVDVVTSVSFGTQDCKLGPGQNKECTVVAPPRTDGAVVFDSTDRGLEVKLVATKRSDRAARFELPAGRQRLQIKDRGYECPAAWVDVPRGADVAYVFVSTAEHDRTERCRAITVTQHKLRFAN